MADVSPIMTHEAGAGPKVNKTEMMRPKEACARLDEVDTATEPAIPRTTRKPTLMSEPQT
jgi:hypothetical protein